MLKVAFRLLPQKGSAYGDYARDVEFGGGVQLLQEDDAQNSLYDNQEVKLLKQFIIDNSSEPVFTAERVKNWTPLFLVFALGSVAVGSLIYSSTAGIYHDPSGVIWLKGSLVVAGVITASTFLADLTYIFKRNQARNVLLDKSASSKAKNKALLALFKMSPAYLRALLEGQKSSLLDSDTVAMANILLTEGGSEWVGVQTDKDQSQITPSQDQVEFYLNNLLSINDVQALIDRFEATNWSLLELAALNEAIRHQIGVPGVEEGNLSGDPELTMKIEALASLVMAKKEQLLIGGATVMSKEAWHADHSQAATKSDLMLLLSSYLIDSTIIDAFMRAFDAHVDKLALREANGSLIALSIKKTTIAGKILAPIMAKLQVVAEREPAGYTEALLIVAGSKKALEMAQILEESMHEFNAAASPVIELAKSLPPEQLRKAAELLTHARRGFFTAVRQIVLQSDRGSFIQRLGIWLLIEHSWKVNSNAATDIYQQKALNQFPDLHKVDRNSISAKDWDILMQMEWINEAGEIAPAFLLSSATDDVHLNRVPDDELTEVRDMLNEIVERSRSEANPALAYKKAALTAEDKLEWTTIVAEEESNLLKEFVIRMENKKDLNDFLIKNRVSDFRPDQMKRLLGVVNDLVASKVRSVKKRKDLFTELKIRVEGFMNTDNAEVKDIQGGIDLGQGDYLKVIGTDAAGMPKFDPAQLIQLQKDLRGIVPVPIGGMQPVNLKPLLGLDPNAGNESLQTGQLDPAIVEASAAIES